MTYTLSTLVQLGPGNTGKVLVASLLEPDGDLIGAPANSNFFEIQKGDYAWTADFPDGFRGFALISSADGYECSLAINPQEHENSDKKTSAIASQLTSQPPVIKTVTPVARNGKITVFAGDDYTQDIGRAITVVDQNNIWPALSVGDDVRLGVAVERHPINVVSFDGRITSLTPTIASVDVTGVKTKLMSTDIAFPYTVSAIVSGRSVTLAEGNLVVKERF